MMAIVRTRRERQIALIGIVAVAGVCWAWLGRMLWDMTAMPVDGVMAMPPGGAAYLGWLVIMWLVMMAAMMLPSAAPMTLAFADFSSGRDRRADGRAVGAFVSGYVAAWAAFSLVAATVQWGLEHGSLMSSMTMAVSNETIAGCVLIAAGLYQWTPLKHVCLRNCRSPIGFLMTQWRDGPAGAALMGWRHGLFCVGCCWALMALLFVAGVMNALWIVGLTLFVVVEKVAPHGDTIARAAGVGLMLAGRMDDVLMLAAYGLRGPNHPTKIPRGVVGRGRGPVPNHMKRDAL